MKNYTKIILCLLFLLGWSAEGMAQLEENRYEFWREDAKVTYDMFLDTTTEWKQEREKNFKICLFYSTALNNGKEFGRTMTSSFLREVVIPEDHYLYQEYRKTIDKMLEILKEYATTEEEIQRFVTKTPQPGYIESPFFIDDRELRGTIRY